MISALNPKIKPFLATILGHLTKAHNRQQLWHLHTPF
jgi:hypothetical protein